MSRQLLEYHPVISYRFIPGIKARIPHENGGYLIQTNSSGFRCRHEFIARRTNGYRRVLLFGDSLTAGDGVSNGQRYGDMLEQSVERTEVFNFGLPATGPDQHLLVFQQFATEIEADLTIIAITVHNIRRTSARYRIFRNEIGENVCYAKPFFALEDGRLSLQNVPVAKEPIPEGQLRASDRKSIDRGGRFRILRDIVTRMHLRSLAQKVTGYQPLPEYEIPETSDWRLMRAVLEAFIGSASTPVILMPIPLYQHIEETTDASAYQARFREVTWATKAILHDPLPHLRSFSPGERRAFRFTNDLHFTPEGHAALAASLSRSVRTLIDPSPR